MVLVVVAGRSGSGGNDTSTRLLRAPGERVSSAGEADSSRIPLLRGRQPVAAGARRAPDAITFGTPVNVSTSTPDTQAAEPSIRVDASDPNNRIWISAPTGLGARVPPLRAGGDLFWHSDDDGDTWTVHEATTLIGGGDSDLTTSTGQEVYVTGLTLANVTLAASCDNGQTFVTNPISNVGTVEDRQWLDMYEDTAKPVGAPDFVMDVGLIAASGMAFYQIFSPPPACSPPEAGPVMDVSHANCISNPLSDDCYQWPGNVAVDENTGHAYATHNTLGNPNNDDVVVARIDGGASTVATQANVTAFVAANNRPDTFDSFTVVAVDTASNVYALWTERHPEVQETWSMYAYSTDDGETWSAPIKVNTAAVKTTTFPWIVAGSEGRIDIVYYGTDANGPSPEEVPATSDWKVYMAQSLNAASATPTFEEVAATGFMHEGPICTSGTGCDPGTRDLLDFFMIDIDEQCLANIAYTDTLNPPGGDDYVVFVQQNGGTGICATSAVTLRSLDARAKGRAVNLHWRTAAEPTLLGFNVFRSDAASRETKVNRSLIRAKGSVRGASYRLVDRKVRKGVKYQYRLQAVSSDGSRTWARSVRITPR